jgi:hypothetical protein
LQNEREFVTSNQNEDPVSDINETDEEVAAPEENWKNMWNFYFGRYANKTVTR